MPLHTDRTIFSLVTQSTIVLLLFFLLDRFYHSESRYKKICFFPQLLNCETAFQVTCFFFIFLLPHLCMLVHVRVVTHSQMANSHTFLLFKSRMLKNKHFLLFKSRMLKNKHFLLFKSRMLKNKQQDQKVSAEVELLISDLWISVPHKTLILTPCNYLSIHSSTTNTTHPPYQVLGAADEVGLGGQADQSSVAVQLGWVDHAVCSHVQQVGLRGCVAECLFARCRSIQQVAT